MVTSGWFRSIQTVCSKLKNSRNTTRACCLLVNEVAMFESKLSGESVFPPETVPCLSCILFLVAIELFFEEIVNSEG